MVGVAGKSRACHECKRRRVRCDFERPKCLRCTKVGRQCPGYEKQTLFVNRTVKDSRLSASDAISNSTPPEQAPRSVLGDLGEIVQLATAVPRDTNLFRQTAFRLLARIYLPRPEVSEGDPSKSAPFAWVRAICELDLPNEVLDSCLVALCSALVYVEEQRQELYEQAIERYSAALRHLGSALRPHGSANPEYTIASIITLSTCEIFICCTDDGWRAHIQGIADVLRLRYAQGTSQVPKEIWNHLCSRLRVISVLSCISRRQKGILRRSQWKGLMPDYANANSLDNLMDIACELPQALSIYDNASIFDAESKDAMKQMFTVLAHTYKWQSDLREKRSPIDTVGPAQLKNPADDAYFTQLFPHVLNFRSLQVGCYSVLSWALQLQIYTSLLKTPEHENRHSRNLFFKSFESKGSDNNDLLGYCNYLPQEPLKQEADRIARLVCQSFEYCNRLEMGIFGPQTMLFTQWTIRSYYKQVGADRELSWCLNVPNMHGAPTRCGIRLMTFREAGDTWPLD